MNYDDKNKPDLSTLIDPELEARIVAWVSGEASPFEAAELTRLTNEKPELAIFKRRIEAVNGLIGEAIRPDKESLRLAPDRRAKLLNALGAAEFKPNSASATNTVVLPLAAAKKKQRINRRWIYGLAACLTVGLFTLQFSRFESEAAHKEQMAKSEDWKRRETSFHAQVEAAAKHQSEREPSANEFAMADEQTQTQELKGQGITYKKEADFEARRKLVKDGTGRIDARLQTGGSAGALLEVALPVPLLPSTDLNRGIARDYAASPANMPAPSLGFVGQPAAGGKKIAANEEQIVLSPFAVEAKGDAGYAASSTLAGTRIDTQLRDAGSSDKFVTNGFLNSVGATDSIAPLQYAAYGKVNPKLGKESILAEEKPKEVANADPAPAPRPVQPPVQTFSEINAAKEPVSTFSLHVSDVSFRLAQAALAKGEELDRTSIRPEEFYNAFSYGDPTPALAEKVSCRIEQAAHPFVQQRNLVRIAVKVAASGRDAAQPLHLTVLLDTSGSMEREDRAATIQSAMKALTSLLGPNDRLTLIGFSRQPRLLAEALTGDQAAQVLELIKNTPAEGGTNLEEALKLGSELAHRQFDAAAQNRIVLLTDGAANLGNANPAQLAASIEALRQQGIAFDACGVGLEGLDDGMLENLTRKGDGRYYVLNSPEAADAGFAKQLAGAFRPAAENVKLQVRFNPARVGNYRLIGFEQHRLREEDFRNDKVDAAELAAEEAAVAVYQVEALPQGEGELGEVYVRFRDASSGNMVERNWTLNYDPQTPSFDRATPSIQLAGTAALLAEKLQGGEAAAAINLGEFAPVISKLRSHYANEPRVQELVTMFEQARKLAGE